MISLIEALNFRCLRYIRQPLGPFHILVGPNASGKTTFLDVVAFLGQAVSDGIDTAVSDRTEDFMDLVWGRSGERFELAIEAIIPENLREKLRKTIFDTIRYEVAFGVDLNTHEGLILSEKALLKSSKVSQKKYDKQGHISKNKSRSLFPMKVNPPDTILTRRTAGANTVVNKVQGGDDHFYSEVYREPGKGWMPVFKFGPKKMSLANLPGDESQYPVATWLKDLLSEGVQQFILNSILMRKASQRGKIKRFMPDGSNLSWVIHRLKDKDPPRFKAWISHLQTALPDITDIKTIEREHVYRYLVICYRGGLEVPSWLASDGALRLLALTIPAYLPDFKGIYLIEEPENGIHPTAVETMFQSLSSVYDAQMLLATHSPVILGIAKPEEVLCFAKNEEGATDIVLGSEHPSLRDWRRETDLGTLFAAGVLG
ncbi:MAG: ATP-binding protein [Deltaproteobacteria bacterium]|nr:ATP-binding protein [Deltaproteobacteria bacterium]